ICREWPLCARVPYGGGLVACNLKIVMPGRRSSRTHPQGIRRSPWPYGTTRRCTAERHPPTVARGVRPAMEHNARMEDEEQSPVADVYACHQDRAPRTPNGIAP